MYFDRFPAEAGLTPEWLHPYRAARVVADGVTVGWFGQLHPREAAARKIKDAVLVGELYLDRLYKLPLRRAVGAGDLALSAGAARFFTGSGREHRVGDGRPRDGGAADSRAGGVARARGVSRCAAGQGRVCAAAGRDVPGAGPHAARRGAAGVPGAGGGGGWQRRERGCAFEQNIGGRAGAILERNRPAMEVDAMSEIVHGNGETSGDAGSDERQQQSSWRKSRARWR